MSPFEIERLLPAICCPLLLWMAFRLYVLGSTGRLGRSSLNGTIPAAICFAAACVFGGLAIARPDGPHTTIVTDPISTPVHKQIASTPQIEPLRPVDKVVFAVPSSPEPAPLTGALPDAAPSELPPHRRVLADLAPPEHREGTMHGKATPAPPPAKPLEPRTTPAAPPDPAPSGPVDDIDR